MVSHQDFRIKIFAFEWKYNVLPVRKRFCQDWYLWKWAKKKLSTKCIKSITCTEIIFSFRWCWLGVVGGGLSFAFRQKFITICHCALSSFPWQQFWHEQIATGQTKKSLRSNGNEYYYIRRLDHDNLICNVIHYFCFCVSQWVFFVLLAVYTKQGIYHPNVLNETAVSIRK